MEQFLQGNLGAAVVFLQGNHHLISAANRQRIGKRPRRLPPEGWVLSTWLCIYTRRSTVLVILKRGSCEVFAHCSVFQRRADLRHIFSGCVNLSVWLPKIGARCLSISVTLLWDALSSRAECSDFCGASEGSDAFRALGTCSSFCLRLKDCENVNKQLCTLYAETDSTFWCH